MAVHRSWSTDVVVHVDNTSSGVSLPLVGRSELRIKYISVGGGSHHTVRVHVSHEGQIRTYTTPMPLKTYH